MLHYQKIGTGKPIVLVHGFPNDGTTWDPLRPLRKKNHQYLIPDLPGAGKSAFVENLSLEKMAQGLLEILDKEKIDQALFVGHSMGGYTVMEAATLFPERIKAISLVHSLASADSEEKVEARRKSIRLLQNGDKGKEVFLEAMAANLFGEEFANEHPEAVAEIVKNGQKLTTEALTEFYTAIMNRSSKVDWLKQNNSIPMQWIIGDEDKATPMKEALEQCYLSKWNDVQVYRGVGHMSMMEVPVRLAQSLNTFIDYIWK